MNWLVGLDLTAGPRPATLAALSADLRQHHLEETADDQAILTFISRVRPLAVGIDAPLGLPDGQCCLELSCPCAPIRPGKGRAAERALSRLGIPSYYTTKRSFIKSMVYRAMELRRELEQAGFVALEVYPYATRVRLFGKPLPRKSSPEGRQLLESGLSQLLGRPVGRLSHDQADALLCTYTAWLWTAGKTEAVGDPTEQQIHIPRQGE